MRTLGKSAGATLLVLWAAGPGMSAHRSPRSPAAGRRRPATAEHRPAALIERTGLAEFSPATDVTDTMSPLERQVTQAMRPVFEQLGQEKSQAHVEDALRMTAAVIDRYPDYGGARWLRARLLMMRQGDRGRDILADLDAAIRLHASRKYRSVEYGSLPALYALRAKAHFLAGDFPAGMADLQAAILAKPDETDEIFDAGSARPGDRSNPTAISKQDLETLVSRYPGDYRPYLFRGLFYAAETTFASSSFSLATADLERAAQRNPGAAIVPYEIGLLLRKQASWSQAAVSRLSDPTGANGGSGERTAVAALSYFERAEALQPDLSAAAEAQMAASLYGLKRYAAAVRAYDRLIVLEPDDGRAYNELGVVRVALGDESGAIDDFSKAIARQADPDTTYENRAAAEMTIGRYRDAVADYGRAIGLRLRERLYALTIPELRALYPELHAIPDRQLVEGLRQKYFPAIPAGEFEQHFADERPFQDFVLADSYADRGDAYLQWGDFRRAAVDYSRAHVLFPAEERWRALSGTARTQYAIDTATLKPGGKTPSLWLKRTSVRTGAYTEEHYRFDCDSGRIRMLSSIRFTWFGYALGTGAGGPWRKVAPGSIDGTLYTGACR